MGDLRWRARKFSDNNNDPIVDYQVDLDVEWSVNTTLMDIGTECIPVIAMLQAEGVYTCVRDSTMEAVPISSA